MSTKFCSGSIPERGVPSCSPPRDQDYRDLVRPQLNGRQLLALLNSGADFSRLFLAASREAGVSPDSPGVEVIGALKSPKGEEAPLRRGTYESFAPDQEQIKPAILLFGDPPLSNGTGNISGGAFRSGITPPGMLLGVDFMASHRMLFSHSQGKLYFTYAGGDPFWRSGGHVADPASD